MAETHMSQATLTRVVIESPLGAATRAEIDEHKRYARRAVLDSLARGEAPYAAHLFFDQPELLDDLLPDQRQQGLLAGLTWAAQAEVCAAYLDRGCSAGMRIGLAQARQLGMRISLRFLDRFDVVAWRVAVLAADLTPSGQNPAATVEPVTIHARRRVFGDFSPE